MLPAAATPGIALALCPLGLPHRLAARGPVEVLAENKRLMYIKEISEKYAKLYQQFNKEEKITIISAYRLSAAEEQ